MKWFKLCFTALALCATLLLLGGCGEEVITLNVYNWGEYISDGSEGTLDVNAAFEEYYYETYGKRVQVNYTTYASNEDMYAKLRSGATGYDVVIPSDYMIERMINEDMLLPLNFDNIPNYQYIAPDMRDLFYDPQNIYSVPYTYGLVGIIYNTTMVDEADTGSWDLMWNEKYQGKILQFNNARDAFGTAMYWHDIDVNTTDEAQWREALELLKAQKPIVQGYVMDEIFNKMKGASAAIAAYYAGDYLTMYDSNSDLDFYYPSEGTNIFTDAMCIPSCAQHKDVAEAYINFMLSEEIAIANAEYICYASPHMLVRENDDYRAYLEDFRPGAYDILYPDLSTLDTQAYAMLDVETQSLQNRLWEELKIESSVGSSIYTVAMIIIALLLLLLARHIAIQRYRAWHLKNHS
ncbi:MAG: spermidine/putrescine ABC transporter substrate-binding protein [Clostridia bacterium]|nr:spermidine/putrescine ABC transporter substrate-binding protein [Clostridia bacterium]